MECASENVWDSMFPYTRVKEKNEGFQEGSERFEVDYIEREAAILIRFLRDPKKDTFGNLRPYPKMDERDYRILRRWGIK